ncbi:hypothetical protein HDU76_012761 [Blyttiomyces sp. JEL0837]|nr:hypothetical protein HDU76_012761 [Blyttiomyces sp. JEL0837]
MEKAAALALEGVGTTMQMTNRAGDSVKKRRRMIRDTDADGDDDDVVSEDVNRFKVARVDNGMSRPKKVVISIDFGTSGVA